jgi:RNA polymerase sigma-70 factor (ECF subfamily)
MKMDTERTTDEQLMSRVRDGDEHAFATIMDAYIDRVYYVTRYYVKTDEAADDIVQETFFKVWKYRRRYSVEKLFKPWLFSIARNTCLDHIKKKKDSAFSSLDTEDTQFADTIVDTGDLPDEQVQKKEHSLLVSTLLDTLHPEYRSVVVMHDLEDMTFADIGVALNKPLNTVKSWYRRAMQQLQKTYRAPK